MAKNYKLGDIYEVKPGSLVARPDGIVVTAGGDHALNLAGEYVITDNKGKSVTVNVDGPPEPEGDPEYSSRSTNSELEDAIAKRNEGRDEADLIVPDGTTKAALLAALAADDEN